jgi:hypothetical protein
MRGQAHLALGHTSVVLSGRVNAEVFGRRLAQSECRMMSQCHGEAVEGGNAVYDELAMRTETVFSCLEHESC